MVPTWMYEEMSVLVKMLFCADGVGSSSVGSEELAEGPWKHTCAVPFRGWEVGGVGRELPPGLTLQASAHLLTL